MDGSSATSSRNIIAGARAGSSACSLEPDSITADGPAARVCVRAPLRVRAHRRLQLGLQCSHLLPQPPLQRRRRRGAKRGKAAVQCGCCTHQLLRRVLNCGGAGGGSWVAGASAGACCSVQTSATGRRAKVVPHLYPPTL